MEHHGEQGNIGGLNSLKQPLKHHLASPTKSGIAAASLYVKLKLHDKELKYK